MDSKILLEELVKIGYLDKKISGTTVVRRYPHLYKRLKELTLVLDTTFVVNTKMRSRFIFLSKYDGDINKITKNGSWLTFVSSVDDFCDRTGNYVKRGWESSKNNLTKEIPYNFVETKEILNRGDFYLKCLGKSKNRTILKNHPKLYVSIYEHTKFMDEFNINSNKFSHRVLYLKNHECPGDIKCKKCKVNYTSFNPNTRHYNKLCHNCFHKDNPNKYPQKGWFRSKYGNKWEEHYNDFIINNDRRLRFNGGTSKISQKLFWSIYEELSEDLKNKCFFKDLNNEYFLNHKGYFYFIDFICGDKVIEFDGIYWHKDTKEKDEVRNQHYKEVGYHVLSINEHDITNKEKTKQLIKKCVSFINNEN